MAAAAAVAVVAEGVGGAGSEHDAYHVSRVGVITVSTEENTSKRARVLIAADQCTLLYILRTRTQHGNNTKQDSACTSTSTALVRMTTAA